ADLQITKADNLGGNSVTGSAGTAIPGNAIAYTIVVRNAGPSNAPGSAVADTFSNKLTGVSYTATATGGATGFTAASNGNINDPAVNLPADSTVTYTVQATVQSSATATVSNTATVAVAAGVTDPTAANNRATATHSLSAQADLQITKTDNLGG